MPSNPTTYRVPPEWLERRRLAARLAAPLVALVAIAILALALWPRVDWSQPRDRTAAAFVICIVAIGLVLGGLAGRISFRSTMRRWASFQIDLTEDELVRTMDGEEVRIQRENVNSIREFPQRGFMVSDRLGWRIFVPKTISNYEAFRIEILKWSGPR